ncbi:hypothetical protein G7062_05010 [Erysipelothrix sp. HDW6C]|uniref:hypothetical protein n=1 Tax=Erysipelothrix sp. HDW6C TaxID=2714930 RepID=UPI00140B60F8|nr:hypothetical protein [Erysipelothrix sp. HDW6C]QIK69693.1 hypothetical protein G7062_05010 [Erysipelothrix sp. HDW6C]
MKDKFRVFSEIKPDDTLKNRILTADRKPKHVYRLAWVLIPLVLIVLVWAFQNTNQDGRQFVLEPPVKNVPPKKSPPQEPQYIYYDMPSGMGGGLTIKANAVDSKEHPKTAYIFKKERLSDEALIALADTTLERMGFNPAVIDKEIESIDMRYTELSHITAIINETASLRIDAYGGLHIRDTLSNLSESDIPLWLSHFVNFADYTEQYDADMNMRTLVPNNPTYDAALESVVIYYSEDALWVDLPAPFEVESEVNLLTPNGLEQAIQTQIHDEFANTNINNTVGAVHFAYQNSNDNDYIIPIFKVYLQTGYDTLSMPIMINGAPDDVHIENFKDRNKR